VIAVGVIASFFASVLGCINASARIIYALSRQGVLHGKAGDAHEAHSTPHVAIAISALIVVVLFLPLAALSVKLMDVYGYLGSISTFGFLASYLLVSIGAPVFLKKRGELKPRNVAVSAVSVVLVGIPFIGVLYPVPDYPLNLLPYVFVGLLLLGALYFLYLRRKSPEALALIEQNLEASPALSEQPAE
jgi:amino acid transporter